MKRELGGMTLIELLIVVAVIGILASIAYPSYTQYVLRTNRADAKTILLETAQFLERNYTEANRFDKTTAGKDISLPYSQSPRSGGAKYLIGFAAGGITSSAYTLQATPTGPQTNDSCGTLTLNSLGQQAITGAASGMIAAVCWQQ